MTQPGVPLRLLAIDTCLGACSAAAAVEGSVRAQAYEERRTGHAEAIVPMLERVLAEAGMPPESLERIAVTIGPGTFAGMRIGLAAAGGLKLATGAALIPVSSFWAIGQRVLAAHGPFHQPLAIAVDAGRGQVYLELMDRSGEPMDGPVLIDIGAAIALVAGKEVLLAGSGALQIAGSAPERVVAGAFEPRAADFAVAAGCLPIATGPVHPLYFRPADAVVQSPPGLRA